MGFDLNPLAVQVLSARTNYLIALGKLIESASDRGRLFQAPGINEPADVEELAIFISEINPAISIFIEPWIPVLGVEFEEHRKHDLIDAVSVSRAMKHLYVVSKD